jgi:hypothetical protein
MLWMWTGAKSSMTNKQLNVAADAPNYVVSLAQGDSRRPSLRLQRNLNVYR